MLRKVFLAFVFALSIITCNAQVSKQKADSIANLLNQKEEVCDTKCPLYKAENPKTRVINTIFADALVVIGAIWLYTNKKRKIILVLGGAVAVILGASLFLNKTNPNNCKSFDTPTCVIENKNAPPAASTPAAGLSDFESVDPKETATPSQTSATTASSDLSDFESVDSPESSTASATDSSSDLSDFESTEGVDSTAQVAVSLQSEPQKKGIDWTSPLIIDPIIVFVLLGIISYCMKFKNFVKYRGLFLLLGVAWLGFYRGGCTCMIGGFQNLILGVFGVAINWWTVLWVGTLVVATYLFGRVWCGWLCHLGAIQEFLFHSAKLQILKSDNSRKVLKIIRYVAFGVWCLYLIIIRKNIFCEIDPFKALFNLFFGNWISVALLVILLVSSVLIYRPFCRTLCPVGVLLGWVSMIPGARKINTIPECVNCGSCVKTCPSNAIAKKDKAEVDTESCLACGECTLACHKDTIKLKR